MRIAVIGGGITGLTAAYQLTKTGHEVTVFEREKYLGGLAWGFTEPGWDWHLEGAYHHLFTNDDAIIDLMRKLGIEKKLMVKRPVTANFYNGKTYQLDSPMHLLTFPLLSPIDRLRTGALVAFCKIYPFWQTLEGVTAKQFFTAAGGRAGWRVIWEPLMTGKFGHFDDTIAASWLWARIHKRTTNLCYIEGGFQTLITTLAQAIKKNGGKIHTNTTITSIKKASGDKYYVLWKEQKQLFDRVLLTVPTPIASRMAPQLLTTDYLLQANTIPHLHAQTLILETKEPILDTIYWLSVTDRTFPFLAAVAHTNFMDKTHYGNHHLTYFGNYLPDGHPYLSMTKEQLLNVFLPFIQRLSPATHYKLLTTHLFTGPFAQPVHQLHYSRRAPKLETGIPGVYLANMDSIYPWDRGTNYAVELGQKAAQKIIK